MDQAKTAPIPYLDGWRGLAIVFVLFCHFGPPRHSWIGLMGVNLFFVLSGLLMSRLLFMKRVDLPTFFARRVSRIVPTFWVFIIAMAIYGRYGQPLPYVVPPSEILFTLAFLRTYLPIDADIWLEKWAMGNVWSLNVEEHSYVFLALGALLCRKSRNPLAPLLFLTASVAAVLAVNIFYMANPPVSGSPWFVRSEAGSLSLLAAAALCVGRSTLDRLATLAISPLMPILTFVVALACCSTYSHKGVDRVIAPFCLAYSVVYLDQVPCLLRRLISHPLLRWFGTRSFSLYLWQHPFYLLTTERDANPSMLVALAVGTGALSYRLLENPLRMSMNRAWDRGVAGMARRYAASAPRPPSSGRLL